jgi:hypothetical protein
MGGISVEDASVDELRELVKGLIAAQHKEPEPKGLDMYSNLPVFLDKPECPRCKPFSEMHWDAEKREYFAICHDCQQPIPHPTMEFNGRGIESATVDHLHTHDIQKSYSSAAVRTLARRELCLPCFRIDWAKAHPGKPCDL